MRVTPDSAFRATCHRTQAGRRCDRAQLSRRHSRRRRNATERTSGFCDAVRARRSPKVLSLPTPFISYSTWSDYDPGRPASETGICETFQRQRPQRPARKSRCYNELVNARWGCQRQRSPSSTQLVTVVGTVGTREIGLPRPAADFRKCSLYNDIQSGRPDSNRRRPAWEAERNQWGPCSTR